MEAFVYSNGVLTVNGDSASNVNTKTEDRMILTLSPDEVVNFMSSIQKVVGTEFIDAYSEKEHIDEPFTHWSINCDRYGCVSLYETSKYDIRGCLRSNVLILQVFDKSRLKDLTECVHIDLSRYVSKL